MPTSVSRRGGVAGRSVVVLAVLAAAALVAGCASGGSGARRAGPAATLGFFSAAPMPSVAITASVGSGSAAATSLVSSPTPCPLPAPQQFVEGKSAVAHDGSIVFSYVDATRMCGGPDDVQYLAKTSVVTSATVDPAAVVLVLPPDGSTQVRQIPAAALPAAMRANTQSPFYAITYGSAAGRIERIEQYFHP